MTLPNFDWTDKNSLRWFLLLPTGHEGPYALETLQVRWREGKLSSDILVWTEGLSSPEKLKLVLEKSQEMAEEDTPPPLPPLPEDDELPPLPQEPQAHPAESPVDESRGQRKIPAAIMAGAAVLVMLLFGGFQWVKSEEKFIIARQPKMSPELHKKILSSFKFEGWNKKIFFKEFVPKDLTHIWFITSGFQTCEVDGHFRSIDGKLLTEGNEEVVFKSQANLNGHIAEFSSFDFIKGKKVIPGLYEVDIKASQCQWDGLVPQLANMFSPPETEYVARTKVILFSEGAEEFNKVLDKLIRKKMELEIKGQNQENIFWDSLQLKFQTLLAITLEIEHLFIDFLDKDPGGFKQNLSGTVDSYTKKFGRFLTEFVVANEDYFKNIPDSLLKDPSKKRNYELLVRLTSKRIGYESMQIIEDLQKKKKNPSKTELQALQRKVQTIFKQLKTDIDQKLIQVTEDRSS